MLLVKTFWDDDHGNHDDGDACSVLFSFATTVDRIHMVFEDKWFLSKCIEIGRIDHVIFAVLAKKEGLGIWECLKKNGRPKELQMYILY